MHSLFFFGFPIWGYYFSKHTHLSFRFISSRIFLDIWKQTDKRKDNEKRGEFAWWGDAISLIRNVPIHLYMILKMLCSIHCFQPFPLFSLFVVNLISPSLHHLGMCTAGQSMFLWKSLLEFFGLEASLCTSAIISFVELLSQSSYSHKVFFFFQFQCNKPGGS